MVCIANDPCDHSPTLLYPIVIIHAFQSINNFNQGLGCIAAGKVQNVLGYLSIVAFKLGIYAYNWTRLFAFNKCSVNFKNLGRNGTQCSQKRQMWSVCMRSSSLAIDDVNCLIKMDQPFCINPTARKYIIVKST